MQANIIDWRLIARHGTVGGGRNQEMAFAVVHEIKGRLAADCVPVFSTDGLKHYYNALTVRFGQWQAVVGKKPVWVHLHDFVYAQVRRLSSYILLGE